VPPPPLELGSVGFLVFFSMRNPLDVPAQNILCAEGSLFFPHPSLFSFTALFCVSFAVSSLPLAFLRFCFPPFSTFLRRDSRWTRTKSDLPGARNFDLELRKGNTAVTKRYCRDHDPLRRWHAGAMQAVQALKRPLATASRPATVPLYSPTAGNLDNKRCCQCGCAHLLCTL